MQGARQGDPLWLALFILVTDVLTRTRKQADKVGLVKGIRNNPCFRGIKNYHFADSTLLFCSGCLECLLPIKAILLAFDKALRLRIYFNKSLLLCLNMGEVDEANHARMLMKLSSRFAPWKGKLLSGRVELLLSIRCFRRCPPYQSLNCQKD